MEGKISVSALQWDNSMKKKIKRKPRVIIAPEVITEIKSRRSHTKEDFDILGTYYIQLLYVYVEKSDNGITFTPEEEKEMKWVEDTLDDLNEKLMPF